MISIKGLDKAAVLAALYNRARTQGLGLLHFTPADMSVEEAREEIEKDEDNLYFDYVKGRVMKVELKGDELDPRLYDRDNGENKAYSALHAAGLI